MIATTALSSCASSRAPVLRPEREPQSAAASVCTHDASGVTLSADHYASRTGVMAQRFSELGATTKQRPLEECGIPQILTRLLALRCDNGSNPFDGEIGTAHASRRGSVGPGGRCGSIIDLYVVPCPERTYEVFADSYICAPRLRSE